jgi:putative transposase
MAQIKAYRFQLRARPCTEAQLRRYSGMTRWIWNRAVAEQRARFARGEKYAGYFEMCRWLKAWREDPRTQWLAEGPIHVEQQVLRRLDGSYRRYFKAAMNGRTPKVGESKRLGRQVGRPRFKSFGNEPGLRFPSPDHIELDSEASRIKLPKLGWIRMRQSQPVVGIVKNASVGREGGRWFVSLQVEMPDIPPRINTAPTLGIDLGLTNFAAFSDAIAIAGHASCIDLVPAPKFLARTARQVRHAQEHAFGPTPVEGT